jgi:hypothetical protein
VDLLDDPANQGCQYRMVGSHVAILPARSRMSTSPAERPGKRRGE